MKQTLNKKRWFTVSIYLFRGKTYLRNNKSNKSSPINIKHQAVYILLSPLQREITMKYFLYFMIETELMFGKFWKNFNYFFENISVICDEITFMKFMQKFHFLVRKVSLPHITFYSQSISSWCSYAEVRPKTHESCIIGFMISNIVTKMKYQSWTAGKTLRLI